MTFRHIWKWVDPHLTNLVTFSQNFKFVKMCRCSVPFAWADFNFAGSVNFQPKCTIRPLNFVEMPLECIGSNHNLKICSNQVKYAFGRSLQWTFYAPWNDLPPKWRILTFYHRKTTFFNEIQFFLQNTKFPSITDV